MRPVIGFSTFVAGLLVYSLPVSAALITLEPDDFAPGTNVSFAMPGATIWTARESRFGGIALSPVYTTHDPACDAGLSGCYAVTGSSGFSPTYAPDASLFNWGPAYLSNQLAPCIENIFGSPQPPAFDPVFGFEGCRNNAGAAMFIILDNPTDFVQIGGAFNSDFAHLIAYDENFNKVGSLTYTCPFDGLPISGPTGCHVLGSANQSYVSITSPMGDIKYVLAGSIADNTALDHFGYGVPEPSTLLLSASGVLLWGARRVRLRRGLRSRADRFF